MKKRREIEVAGERIPRLDDVATLLYMATPEGDWPQRPIDYIRGDITWLQEGAVLTLRNLDPSGQMGATQTVQVIATQTEIQLHAGKYGQVLRRVLLATRPSEAEISQTWRSQP
jgi:hypothetical protein